MNIVYFPKAILLFFAALLFCTPAWAQTHLTPIQQNFLRLQLSSGFLTVAKDARIDLDSSLAITSRRQHLSRIPVITEDLDIGGAGTDLAWMDQHDLTLVKRKLSFAKGVEYARLAMLIGAYYSFQPGLKTKNTDEGIIYLKKARIAAVATGSTRLDAESAILLGKCYMKNGNIPDGKAAFAEITDNPLWSGDKRLNAKAWNYLGTYCPFVLETVTLRVSSLQKAAKMYHDLKDGVNEANILTNLGYLNYVIGNLKESENSVNRSVAMQVSFRFPFLHYSRDLQAYLSKINGNYNRELSLGLASVKSAEETRDSLGLSYFYARVADAYVQDDNHTEESNVWYKKALQEFIRNGGDPALYRLLSNSSFVEYGLGGSKALLNLLGQLRRDFPPLNPTDKQHYYLAAGACYEDLDNFQMAEKYYLMAERLESETRLVHGNMSNGYVYHRIGHFYLNFKNYKKSTYFLLKYISGETNARVDSSYLCNTYLMLAKADSAMGKFPDMRNIYQYAMLKDKLYTNSKNREVNELSVRYQTLQKQKDVEMYKAKNLLQQQQALATKRITYAGMIIMLLVIFFILRRYYSKQKSARILQLQKDEIASKNQQLQAVIGEKDDLLVSKEWLLKEIHHRVKNNLQLVMSLLNSQTLYLKDEAALNAVMESRHRVQAMSLIHQKLYQTENVSGINMREYIKSLVEYLKDSFQTKLSIYFELRISPIRLDVIQAIPVGLILNEIVTNAIKHAFPHKGDERITIVLEGSVMDEIVLTVTDNGRGIPSEGPEPQGGTFGMTLINGLSADLEGTFSMSSTVGLTIASLSFAGHELTKVIASK